MREPAVAELEALLTARAGLSLGGARGRHIRHALMRDLVGDGIESAEQLRARLDAGDERAFDRLCELATVQESFFFRERARLDLVRRHVLPSLGGGPARVWSAGCAGGEEAYTLAMLLTDAGLGGRFRVTATDLSPAAVATARRGVYSAWSLRGVSEPEVRAGFTRTADGYVVRDRFRVGVEVLTHNLLDPAPPSGAPFDLVVCRNVLIYLTADAATVALQRLAAALRPGGWLVTGVSDPVPEQAAGLERVVTEHGTGYRRTDPLDLVASREGAAEVPPGSASGDLGSAGHQASRRSSQRSKPRPPSRRPSAGTPVSEPATAAPTQGMLVRAEEALQLARPGEAAGLARLVLRQQGPREQAHHVLARALADDDRLAEALDAAALALSEFPVSAPLRGLQAVLLLEAGRTDEAVVAARQALYLDGADALAHVALTRALEQLGDHAGAYRARRNRTRTFAQVAGP